jgi:hypothetical protein
VVPAAALADVVHQAAEQQQVRPAHPGGQPGGPGAGLDEVPVDGPDVRPVARGQVAHRAPLREQPPPESGAVQRLHHVDQRAAGAQQRQQLAQRRVGPGLAQLGGGVGEPVQGAGGDRQSGARRGGGHPQHQPGIAGGRGVPRQHHLTGVLDHAGVQRAAHRCPAQRGQAPAGQRRARRAQPGLGGEGHHARGSGQRPGQLEPVGDRQLPGDLVGVLGAQHVAGPPGDAVQLGAHVEEQRAGLEHLAGRAVDQLGRGQCVDQLDVAQPAVAVLQVRLHPVRHVAVLAPALVGGIGELVEPAADAGPPGLPDRGADLVRQGRVPGDRPGLQ